MDATHLADQVLTASTALAGLLLVVIGSLATSYQSYDAAGQADVRGSFQKRAWFSFSGLACCLIAALCAIAVYWTESLRLADAGAVLLIVALVVTLIAGLISVKDIS